MFGRDRGSIYVYKKKAVTTKPNKSATPSAKPLIISIHDDISKKSNHGVCIS